MAPDGSRVTVQLPSLSPFPTFAPQTYCRVYKHRILLKNMIDPRLYFNSSLLYDTHLRYQDFRTEERDS